jgi:hypothetical protein
MSNLLSRKLFWLAICLIANHHAYTQSIPYWQQQLTYQIDIKLNPELKSLDGDCKINYINRSPDTLTYIWIHLWPNAYRNDHTAFSEQLLENGRTDFYFAAPEKRGFINQLDFKVNDASIDTELDTKHADLVRINLNRPVFPNDSILIETPFHLQLPSLFSRMGYEDGMFHLTQWYPKPAVYDQDGWHPMPYLDQGEFYSEWADYTVSIRLPDSFQIAATGVLKSKEKNNDHTQTWTFQQERIHDFALFANTGWVVETDTLQTSDQSITIELYRKKRSVYSKVNLLDLAKRSLQQKIELVGPFPYSVIRLVESSRKEGGGMEYPMIVLFDATPDPIELQSVVHHEIGHQWFYGLLASNERKHPWMDEGFNSYYDQRFFPPKFEPTPIKFLNKRLPFSFDAMLIQHLQAIHRDQAIETPADQLTPYNYQFITYLHTAQWLKKLESKLGQSRFDEAMRAYYKSWSFKHPTPQNFKSIIDSVAGVDLNNWYDERFKTGLTEDQKRKTWKLRFLFDLNQSQSQRSILWLPLMGYNQYDRWMPGLLLHNYGLAPTRFQFYALPMLSTHQKTVRGLAGAEYTRYGKKWGERWSWTIRAAHFTKDSWLGAENKSPVGFAYHVIRPGLTYRFGNRNPRSTIEQQLGWNTFFMGEQQPNYTFDTTTNELNVYKRFKHTMIHQLSYHLNNRRTLYPYSLDLMAEWGDPFVRLTATGKYHYQYPSGGGLKLRGFLGGFFYNRNVSSQDKFEAERYQLNLSGINGNEDYTYSHYFIGRNAFDRWTQQQMAIRDGGFRIRTDLLNQKIGKTDQWLVSLNATSTIPREINPFRDWNFQTPFRLFLDVGTNADIWQNEMGEPKLLYNAGIQVSLLKEVLNVYLPLMYSKPFKEYVQSVLPQPSWSKRISFSIDLSRLNRKNISPSFPLE